MKIKLFIIIFLNLFFITSVSASSQRYVELADSADFYIRLENWPQAERCIKEALRLEPANFYNSLLFSNLGIIRLSQDNFEEAIEFFRLGLSISPSSTTLLNNRAKAYLLIEDNSKALEDINKSLEIDDQQEWPLQMKAFILLRNINQEEAQNNFLKLKNLYPDNQNAYYGLGLIEEKENRLPQAEEYYKKALDLEFDADIFSQFILVVIEQGKYSLASEELRKAINKEPENPYFYLWRGYLHKLNYRNEEASADRKTAVNKGADPKLVNQYIPLTGK